MPNVGRIVRLLALTLALTSTLSGLTISQQAARDTDLTVRTMAAEGATQDLLLRSLQGIIAARSQRLTIVNTPGQDGVKAALESRKDPPDGRFLLMTSAYTLTYYPKHANAGYNTEEFEPILGIGHYNLVVIAPGSAVGADLRQIIERIRSSGKALRYAGIGDVDRLMMAAIAKKSGVAFEFVSAGGGPALVEMVVKGEVDLGFGTGTHQPMLKEGKVKVVAQLHSRIGEPRLLMPKDFGVDADMDNFILVSAPKGISADKKASVISALVDAVQDPSAQRVITDRLLMTPAIVHGADLDAALARQQRSFEVLRAKN